MIGREKGSTIISIKYVLFLEQTVLLWERDKHCKKKNLRHGHPLW